MKKVILVVMDSVGVGALPDAEQFGDFGVNTLEHIASTGDFNIPHMKQLGIGNIENLPSIEPAVAPIGGYGRMKEASTGKDTTTGHWEIAGLRIDEPFNTFPDGFPDDIIALFEERVGRKIMCNKPASGTTILEELGEEHMKTGKPIVYTSADSVFQIAAHEEIIPLSELYKMCEVAREILVGPVAVARVIARPFIGQVGSFERTPNRRDYSVSPSGDTVLDHLKNDGQRVIGIGKIWDIYNGVGLTDELHTVSNMDGVDQTLEYMSQDFKGLVFTNLVDFDAKYGHRRDVLGYKKALEEWDARIPELIAALKDDDILILTADHGNDPAYKGTDHTREFVPLLVYGPKLKQNVDLGTRSTFADIAQTIAAYLEVPQTLHGVSFLSDMREAD